MLTLQQCADKLGLKVHQVRYMVRTGRLRASKVGTQWFVTDDAPAASPAQQAATDRKIGHLRDVVEDTLAAATGPERQPFSVEHIKAFSFARPLHARLVGAMGADHPAAVALLGALDALAQGAHRFERGDKEQSYRAARDSASTCVCRLLLDGGDGAVDLAREIEREVLPAIAGLLRRLDRKRSG